eukprot:TRINITY_DN15777_c0_g2_i1.p1 TRINITY_DN15777_c0_g2~~TRINITY_DN15777_c0_g2_i1.p1  ORF type:complete len:793 (-),score=115.20 TRINITY_DN15777_c0_g2_i1:246-2624(-)
METCSDRDSLPEGKYSSASLPHLPGTPVERNSYHGDCIPLPDTSPSRLPSTDAAILKGITSERSRTSDRSAASAHKEVKWNDVREDINDRGLAFVPRYGASESETIASVCYKDMEKWESAEAQAYFLDIEHIRDMVRQSLQKPEYSVTNFYRTSGLWQKIARNKFFDYFTLGVIFFNAVWMSIDTDLNKAESLLEADPIFQLAEQGFCVYFSFEWLVRYMSFENKRNCLKDGWFIFDSILVFFMVMETWVMSIVLAASGGAGASSAMGQASILRLLRLLRLSRLARMLRSMPELMIMMKGIYAAGPSVFFTLVLLGIVMYVFAIMFTQLTSDSEVGNIYFPSITGSMFTLMARGTFLDDLTTISRELLSLPGGGLTIFLVFIMFIMLAALFVLNMLIGVLCEVVSAVALTEKEEMNKAFFNSKMKAIIEEIDQDGDNTISKTEFAQIMESSDAINALIEVGVDPFGLADCASYLFEDMDDNNDHSVSLGDFVDMVMSLRGSNTATVKDIIELRKIMQERFGIIEDRLAGLRPLRKSRISVSPSRPSLVQQSLLCSSSSDPTLSTQVPGQLESPVQPVGWTGERSLQTSATLWPPTPNDIPPSMECKPPSSVEAPGHVGTIIDDILEELLCAVKELRTLNEDSHPANVGKSASEAEKTIRCCVQTALKKAWELRSHLPLGLTGPGFAMSSSSQNSAESTQASRAARRLRIWLADFEESTLAGHAAPFLRSFPARADEVTNGDAVAESEIFVRVERSEPGGSGGLPFSPTAFAEELTARSDDLRRLRQLLSLKG